MGIPAKRKARPGKRSRKETIRTILIVAAIILFVVALLARRMPG